jgi:hypothetical protein
MHEFRHTRPPPVVAPARGQCDEKRTGPRRRMLLPAILVFARGTYYFDCTIRDLSEGGARITVPRNAQFPSSLFLINVRDGLAYDAKTVRRAGTEAGLAFVRTLDMTGPRDPALDFLWRLWSQRAARG